MTNTDKQAKDRRQMRRVFWVLLEASVRRGGRDRSATRAAMLDVAVQDLFRAHPQAREKLLVQLDDDAIEAEALIEIAEFAVVAGNP